MSGDDILAQLHTWAATNPPIDELARVFDAARGILGQNSEAERTTSRQIRTGFSDAELRSIEKAADEAGLRPSVWVRERIEGVLRSGEEPARVKRPTRFDTATERLTFWMSAEMVQRLDEMRGALKRSAWVRDVVMRGLRT